MSIVILSPLPAAAPPVVIPPPVVVEDCVTPTFTVDLAISVTFTGECE